MEHDITKKIKSIKIVPKTFTPEGGRPIAYEALELEVVINGSVEHIPFKLTKDRALVLKSIPESGGGITVK